MAKRIGPLTVALGLMVAAAASAEDGGTLNAVAYKPLPAGAAINVRTLDDSEENQNLQQRFEGELRVLGYAVDKRGPLVLSLETRGTVGAWNDGGRRSVLELQSQGDGLGGDRQRMLFNLFDSQSGGVVNPGTAHGTSIVTPSQYRLDVTLEDRASGERVWEAWATADLQQSDSATISQAMVPVLARSLGRTVREQAFALP